MAAKLVRGGFVVTDASQLPDGGLIEQGAVAVEGDRIAAAGSYDELKGRYPDAEELGSDRHVVIPGDHEDLAGALGMLDEGAGALELPCLRPLRQVTGDQDRVELPILNDGFDGLVLLRHCGMPEVHVGAVEEIESAHSRAITASVN